MLRNLVSVPKKTVILQNFAYAQIRAERRAAVRVKVQETVAVTFSHYEAVIEGTILDISASGICINSDLVIGTDRDRIGQLNFTLCGTALAVQGSIVKCAANATGGSIVVIHMKPGRMSEIVIGQFIYQQQIEIIQQLKEGLVAE